MASTLPYGTWTSPITSDLIVSESIGLSEPMIDGDAVYWLEMRPSEGGRCVLVRRSPDGQTLDITPPPFNARTRVHEYGGGSYTVYAGVAYFIHFNDQRIYRIAPGETPVPLTADDGKRFADLVCDPLRNRLIGVCEDHGTGGKEPRNTLAAVSLSGGRVTHIAEGSDFFASPRISPRGRRLAWLAWDHLRMPWDGTPLHIARFNPDGTLAPAATVAGGPEEAIFQPEWVADGSICYVSDQSGWWQIHHRQGIIAMPLTRMDAEFGLPQWVFGMSTYAFESPGRIVCAYNRSGRSCLALLDLESRLLENQDIPFTDVGSIRAGGQGGLFIGASPTIPRAVVRWNPAYGTSEFLRSSFDNRIDAGFFSTPEPIAFPTTGGQTAHAIFYPPRNRDFIPPAGEKPPLLVFSHGGPTAAVGSAFTLMIQFWTSRGIAVLDVNYGGSTGYGRAYRERLRGNWGIVDVDDCVNGALHLAGRGDVDPERLAIRGGSAGGFTTLAALAFRNVFKAGASYYGVSDLEALAQDTHKFESRYLDGLIGPYPERRDLYIERSPIHAVDRLSCPVIFLQGLEDRVVPPGQAEVMVAALRKKGIPVAYLPFAGEQHGFRRSENIKRALDAELYFYGRIFGFTPADPILPVQIDNL